MPSCRSRIGVRDDEFGIQLHYAVGIILDSGFRRNDRKWAGMTEREEVLMNKLMD